MAGVVTTNLIVQFGSPEDAQFFLQAEIDGRDDGLNGGRTQFLPGDQPWFLVYRSPVLDLTFEASSGNVFRGGSELIEQSEFITFARTTEASLSKLPEGAVTFTKLAGTGPSSPTVIDEKLTVPDPIVAVYKAVYNARADNCQLRNVPLNLAGETSFPVVVVIIGTDTSTP